MAPQFPTSFNQFQAQILRQMASPQAAIGQQLAFNFPGKSVVRSPFGLRQLTAGAPKVAPGSVVYGPQQPLGPFAMGQGTIAPAGPAIPMGSGSGLNAAGGFGTSAYGPTLPSGLNAAGGVGTAAYGPAVPAAGFNAAGGVGTAVYGPSIPPAVSSLPGFIQKLGFGGANAAGTSGASQFIRAGLTPKAALGKLVGYPMLGYTAASAIDAINPFEYVGASKNNAFDRFAAGAAGGAGVGAAIGSVLPIGITTAAGAGIGALVGGGINTIRGWFDDASKTALSKKNQKLIDGLNPLMEKAGLTDAQGAQYKTQFDIALQIMRDNGEDSPDNVSKLIKQTQAQISKTAGSNVGKLTSKDMVALQAAIGQYMQPLIQQQQASGDVAAQLYNDMANNMGSSAMANLVRGQAAGYKAQADALSAAYMAKAQAQPALYGLQQTGQLVNQQQSNKTADFNTLLQQQQ